MKFRTLIMVLGCQFAALGLARAGEVVITQKDKKFSSASVDAKLGDTLVFQNDEKDITHNVYSMTAGNEFELKSQRPGEKSTVELDPKKHKPGTMEVECAIHPGMKLKVNIK